MRSKYIFSIFYLVMIVSMFQRIITVLKCTDSDTGTILTNKCILLFMLNIVLIGCASVISLSIRRCPLKMPLVKAPLSLVSFVFSVAILIDIIQIFKTSVQNETSLSAFDIPRIILDLAVIAFFIMYASKSFLKYHIPNLVYVIPLVYWMYNLIVSYIRISKMPLIAENTMLMLATASTVIFWLFVSKLANGIRSDKSIHKKILSVGIFSAITSITFSVPTLISHIIKNTTIHNDICTVIIYLVNGVFVSVFLNSFFSNRNLSKHSHHSGSNKILPLNLEIDK